MAKQDYVPVREGDYLMWHDNFAAQLPALATKYGLTTAQTDQAAADNSNLHAAVTDAETKKNALQAANANKQAKLTSSRANVRALVRQIKAHPAFDDVDGQLLNVIGPEDSTDPMTAKPTLRLRSTAAGQVVIDFTKGPFSGVRILSKRGSETGFTFLATDTESPYYDTRPNLAGSAETREYRAQFLDGDNPVGELSDILTATVPTG